MIDRVGATRSAQRHKDADVESIAMVFSREPASKTLDKSVPSDLNYFSLEVFALRARTRYAFDTASTAALAHRCTRSTASFIGGPLVNV